MKKKILYLSMRFPYPPYGGEKIAMYNYLKSFEGENVQIDLICFDDRIKDPADLIVKLKEEIKIIGDCQIIYIPFWVRILGALLAVLCFQPLQVGYFSNFYTRNKLKNKIKNTKYDRVFVHTIRLFGLTKVINPSTKIILYYVDAISMNFKNAIKKLPFTTRIIYGLEILTLERYEKKSLKSISSGIFHSVIDIEYFQWENNPKIKLLPIMCRRSKEFVPINTNTKKRFLYIANYKAIPNMKGLDELISIDQELAKNNIRIDLVGDNFPKKYHAIVEQLSAIKYRGVVEDLEQEILDSYGVVCPINIGAGMQNKVLDAISKGRPSISYQYAAKPYFEYCRINSIPKENSGIIEYTNSKELINALVFLLNDIDMNNKIGQNAYHTAQLFELETIKTPFKKLFE